MSSLTFCKYCLSFIYFHFYFRLFGDCVKCKRLCDGHYLLFFLLLYNISGQTYESCFSDFSKFVKLDECDLILTHWKTLCDKYLF